MCTMKKGVVKIGNATYEITRAFVGTKTTAELIQERLIAEINQQEALINHQKTKKSKITGNLHQPF